MQLALSTVSTDIARRRLIQSEASFRQGLTMYRKDEYSYQGLAQLYLGWAKRAPSVDEATEYISKAEETITEGLKTVSVREGLWIESSNIQAFLGNEPSRLKALEKAVRENPSSVISRYLLGRAYRVSGFPDKTIDILDIVIKNHHDEYRCFLEYSLSLLATRKSYAEAIAVLELSTLYGLSDPRYTATLGGLLFMDKKFTKAQEIFDGSAKHDFSAQELNTIYFRPCDPTNLQNPLRIKGSVKVVKAGFALIVSPGYPTFLCPGSKFGGLLMVPNLKITFEPAFSAKAAVADKPKLLQESL
jgi:tetratricopeptide (TPR) repeat protein